MIFSSYQVLSQVIINVCMIHKNIDLKSLANQIKCWGRELGFSQTAIADLNLDQAEYRLLAWIKQGLHGEMRYMKKHGVKRTRPQSLVEGTRSVITVRLNYLNDSMEKSIYVLKDKTKGYISRYALGRDYHTVLRNRLRTLAKRIETQFMEISYRAFCDSAPVMEKPLAEKSGHGWIGKHTNLINREHGSWFFLGELYTNIPLPPDRPTTGHCGSCQACIDVCPTKAIIAPYKLDARKCISYLTIELRGIIPIEFREAIENRIYGCDDCQLVCPWNKYAQITVESDFQTRHYLDNTDLTTLFLWDEATFLKKTEGSAIRQISYHQWLRNIAVALGNASGSQYVIEVLKKKQHYPSTMVREHIFWAIDQQITKLNMLNGSWV